MSSLTTAIGRELFFIESLYRVIQDKRCHTFCLSIFLVNLELKGVTGDEKIELYKLGDNGAKISSASLTKDWQIFNFPSVSGLRISFVKDIGDVILRNANFYQIEYLESKSSGWNCDSDKEDVRCARIRKGTFAWKGDYNIKIKHPGIFF